MCRNTYAIASEEKGVRGLPPYGVEVWGETQQGTYTKELKQN